MLFSSTFGGENGSLLPEDPDYGDTIGEFPSMRHAFAYGSGVFTQPGLYENKVKSERPMVDFIFVVETPASWHHMNLCRHRMHYSFISNLQSSMMTSISDRLGAGVYFNPKVQTPHGTIKYGVIGMDALLRDLWTWNSLLVAGRLHKPVRHIVKDSAVMSAVAANLNAAMAASLLLLPSEFSTKELLEGLCGLSYRGDVRVGIAEDEEKVKRIVKGSFEALQELYYPHTQGHVAKLAGLQHVGSDRWVQDKGVPSETMLVACLPKTLRVQIARSAGCCHSNPRALYRVLEQKGAHDVLHSAISHIVRKSSLRQALLGGVTAGAAKGFAYLSAKARKRWKASTDAV